MDRAGAITYNPPAGPIKDKRRIPLRVRTQPFQSLKHSPHSRVHLTDRARPSSKPRPRVSMRGAWSRPAGAYLFLSPHFPDRQSLIHFLSLFSFASVPGNTPSAPKRKLPRLNGCAPHRTPSTRSCWSNGFGPHIFFFLSFFLCAQLTAHVMGRRRDCFSATLPRTRSTMSPRVPPPPFALSLWCGVAFVLYLKKMTPPLGAWVEQGRLWPTIPRPRAATRR